MSATLVITHETTPGDVTIVVDCEHETTTSIMRGPAAAGISEPMAVAMTLDAHDEDAGCDCTAELWQRYGLPGEDR